MRVLLLGARGMLGTDLAATVPRGIELVARGREVDVTSAAAVDGEVAATRPEVIINATGYTAVDKAESEPAAALALNGTAPGLIATAAARGGALVVHYSTDYVFDGAASRPLREDHPTGPLGAYGASKLEGERRLATSGAKHLIIRTQWLFGLNGPSFPATMWKRACAGQPTRVVNDQSGRPTYTVDLASATWKLLGRAATGIIHVTNAGTATWYDVAVEVFRTAGKESALSPCSTAEYPTPARRPRWSVLDTSRYESVAGGPLPEWRDALGRFLEVLKKGAP